MLSYPMPLYLTESPRFRSRLTKPKPSASLQSASHWHKGLFNIRSTSTRGLQLSPLENTRIRIVFCITECSVEHLFREVVRLRRLGHHDSLTMPNGLGKTVWDYAEGNASKLRILAWASNPNPNVLPPRVRSLFTQAYLQLSTAEMAALRNSTISRGAISRSK